MRPALCILAAVLYVALGFITAAYVHEHRFPEVERYPACFNVDDWAETADDWEQDTHLTRSAWAGVVWPAYWFARGIVSAGERAWDASVWLVK